MSIKKILFQKNVPNPHDGAITKAVRLAIGNEFHHLNTDHYLQCTEYAQYSVMCCGYTIDWPTNSGRDGKNWPEIFRDQGKYKVLDSPIKNAVISFTKKAGECGHVAFVENVLPDSSVEISEVNWDLKGSYNERTLTVPQQRAFGAYFIDFNLEEKKEKKEEEKEAPKKEEKQPWYRDKRFITGAIIVGGVLIATLLFIALSNNNPQKDLGGTNNVEEIIPDGKGGY